MSHTRVFRELMANKVGFSRVFEIAGATRRVAGKGALPGICEHWSGREIGWLVGAEWRTENTVS